MRYKLLGPSGLRVSELCLATMSFSDAWGFGADEKQSHRILGDFAEAGGNFIDIANKYHEGQSEEIVGSFLGPGRDRWVVATKYTLAMRSGDPNAAGNSRKNPRVGRGQPAAAADRLPGPAVGACLGLHHLGRGGDARAGRPGPRRHGQLRRPVRRPRVVASQANTLAALRGWSPFVALQIQYSLIKRTAERELLPVAEAFGLSVTAWAPMGAGILTGKYTRGSTTTPEDSRRAAANQARLTQRNLQIAREVDQVADQLGATSAQVATAWVRQRGRRIIPILGIRKPEQLQDLLGSLDIELSTEHRSRLDEVSRIEFGFPYNLLRAPVEGQMVYGDLEPKIELPVAAPYRWQ
jgi:aryl-alcohol dehydrogenase-like predicted oxidoreductase